MNELIKSSTPLSLDDNFDEISKHLEERLKVADNVVVTEDTVKDVKALNITLKRELDSYDKRFKEIKTDMLKPFKDFESSYKSSIKNKYSEVIEKLRTQTINIDNQKKDRKKEVIQKYFYELSYKYGITFVDYDDLNINVTLNATETALKKEVDNLALRIKQDVETIATLKNPDEVMYEYKQNNYNLAEAIKLVNKRKLDIEVAREISRQVDAVDKLEKEVIRITKAKPIIKPIEKRLLLKGTDSQFNDLLAAMETIGISYEVL